jgi:NitT/TauT family transport system substrate-binding protein
MNKQFFKQFAIALVLFLLGYFTFNGSLFAAETGPVTTAYVTPCA